ncbi:MAG TPA: RNA pseudouridine synthase [Gammaproteobacteria bacterium]|nr:RNA pseudouridine synthase [Gammaproteobacteria bacterium]
MNCRVDILSSESNEYHIDVINEEGNAVDLLASVSPFSKQKIKQFMQKGAVWLTDNKGTHRLRRKSKKLSSGMTLHLYYDPSVLDNTVDDAILVADEGDYSVWYKPRGMLSQGSKWGDHCAINRWVEQHLEPQRPAFIIHRLDRFASGLILIAHKKSTASLLADLFQKKKITKQYKVIVNGKFPSDTITINTPLGDKPAVSHASLIHYDESKNKSLLSVDIETGRKHQIRIHLSSINYPVMGDRRYGYKDEGVDLQLSACRLSFIDPINGDKKKYELDASLQPDIKSLPD